MTNRNYLEVLTPENSQIIFIDQQPQMAFGVQSIDRQTLKNNVVGLAKAAKTFNIPTTITCGFNWSMQHNDCLWRKECWHEAKTADLLHRSSESTDVGSLESWRYLARDRQAV